MAGVFTAMGLMVKELVFLVSYVKNNAFPQPLSGDDEKKYLALMAQGDEHARNMLIEHNLRLVAHIVKKFENTGEDAEDLISIGTIGLIKAIESYSSGKGTKLATYAARCIENEIFMTKGGGKLYYQPFSKKLFTSEPQYSIFNLCHKVTNGCYMLYLLENKVFTRTKVLSED